MNLYVNGEPVDPKEIQDEVAALRPRYERFFADKLDAEKREAQLREWSRENIIERVLLRQVARRDPEPVAAEAIEGRFRKLADEAGGRDRLLEQAGVDEEPLRRRIEEALRLERLVESVSGVAPEPTEDQIRAYYEEHADRFVVPELVRASHIVKQVKPGIPPSEVRKRMEKVLAKLRADADFGELVERYSDCRDQAGDLGFFPRGQMVPEFERVVFKLKPGQLSEVFRTPFGYHIAKVIDRRPARKLTLAEAREAVVRELKQDARRAALERFIDEERARSTIEEK